MKNRKPILTILLLLVLVAALLVLGACGQEEGRKARETVEEAGDNALDFAEGFCAAIILVPLGVVIVATRPRDPVD